MHLDNFILYIRNNSNIAYDDAFRTMEGEEKLKKVQAENDALQAENDELRKKLEILEKELELR